MKVSVSSRWKVLTPLFMNKIVKWLCHVFIMTVYSVNVFQCKKSQILVTLPENAQDSTIYYLHSHLKTTVKLDCNKVRRKEGSGQGWLVKTQVCLFKTDKLTQVRTLRHPETSTLSFVSAITLCIRSDCFSLTARALESSLRLSLWTAVPRRLLSGLHANYYNQTQVILILHLTHLLTAVSWVFLPLQTSLNHAPLAT